MAGPLDMLGPTDLISAKWSSNWGDEGKPPPAFDIPGLVERRTATRMHSCDELLLNALPAISATNRSAGRNWNWPARSFRSVTSRTTSYVGRGGSTTTSAVDESHKGDQLLGGRYRYVPSNGGTSQGIVNTPGHKAR